MRRYIDLVILYNLNPYTSLLVNIKYSYTCSALKNNQGRQFSAQTKKLCLFRLFGHNMNTTVSAKKILRFASHLLSPLVRRIRTDDYTIQDIN
jgi:hypothetical protein